MSKKLNLDKEEDFKLVDNVIKEAFKEIVGVEIKEAKITKKRFSSYTAFLYRIARFFSNYTNLTPDEITVRLDAIVKHYEIEVDEQ